MYHHAALWGRDLIATVDIYHRIGAGWPCIDRVLALRPS